MYAIAFCVVGHILLIVSAVPAVITKPDSAIGVLAVAMIVMGLGMSSALRCQAHRLNKVQVLVVSKATSRRSLLSSSAT